MDLQDTTPDSMIRRTPYTVIRIPRLHRTILVDDLIGEATLVLMGLTDLEDIRSMDKRELQTKLSAQRVIYDDRYTDKIHSYLLNDWERAIQNEHEDASLDADTDQEDVIIEYPLTHPNPITGRVAVDEMALFLDRSVIKQDIQGFLTKANPNNSLADLTTKNPPHNTKITLSNGEEIAWMTYLRRASGVLLGSTRGSHKAGQVLKELLKIVGVTFIDKTYFTESNQEAIRKDLEGFLTHADPKDSLADLLSTNPPESTDITLSNGQKMTWQAYLNRSSVVLLGTVAGSHKPGQALSQLLELIGVKAQILMIDKTYFTESNQEAIRKDLEGFLTHADPKDSLTDLLSTNPPQNTKFLLSNNQEITWSTYLTHASIARLGTKHGSHKRGLALEGLLKMVGVVLIDKTYFTESNQEAIGKDLGGFLTKANPNNSLADLTTKNPSQNTKITLSNGQKMTWQAYLNRSSIALLGTVVGSHKPGVALTQLLKMVEVER